MQLIVLKARAAKKPFFIWFFLCPTLLFITELSFKTRSCKTRQDKTRQDKTDFQKIGQDDQDENLNKYFTKEIFGLSKIKTMRSEWSFTLMKSPAHTPS